ncbi:hypothetical protein GXW74_19865 [Roseomonas eburnea]|uniref:DnaT DNA-binding domain-containing protein n=1 Tax=Neoroseomonas eburnea TaxID=1346889 RepID=A0A9X9XGC3_9PROT|nr:hypothetical protein [Neoroseomonas eburnea]MBR0682759.1 hypothetical protein [Neoroseomonas eburnea]
MARIRSVHPGLFTDEAFVTVSPLARILWIGIWTECDDQGAFEWKPVTLKMRILPVDNVDVPALLAELVAADMIRAYTVDGRQYGAVRNFAKFQRPKKPNSLHPIPDEFRTYLGSRGASSEPDDDDAGGSSPPAPPDGPLVPQKSEIAPQMEDGGWREEKETPSLRSGSKKDPPAARRGTRLPPDWQPSDRERAFARQLGLDPDAVAERFRDYWHAKAGKDGAKLDWPATWRNWCRTEVERLPRRPPPQDEIRFSGGMPV